MEKKTTAAKPVVKTTEKEASKSAVKETAAVKSAPAKESVKETSRDKGSSRSKGSSGCQRSWEKSR